MQSHHIGRLQAFMTALCFGLLGVFAKWGYSYALSVGELLAYRFLIASVCLWIFVLLIRRGVGVRVGLRQMLILAGLGVFGYAAMSTTYFFAIQGLSLTMAALLLYTYPFWVSLFSHLFTDQKLSRTDVVSLALAALGLWLLLRGHIEIRDVSAVIAGLASAVIYALYIVFSARLQRGVEPVVSSTYVITFGALALAGLYRPSVSHLAFASNGEFAVLIGIAIVCTILPLTLELAALQKIRSTEFTLIMMLEPVSTAIWGLVLFHETLTFTQVVGALVIVAALSLRLSPLGRKSMRFPRIFS